MTCLPRGTERRVARERCCAKKASEVSSGDTPVKACDYVHPSTSAISNPNVRHMSVKLRTKEQDHGEVGKDSSF